MDITKWDMGTWGGVLLVMICVMIFLGSMYQMVAQKDIKMAEIKANCPKQAETSVFITPTDPLNR